MAKYDFLQTKMDFDGFDLVSYAQILCLFVGVCVVVDLLFLVL